MAPADDGHAVHYSALERGTPVYSSDEVQIGKVVEVLDNYREHIFDGIVIELTAGGRRFVDAPEVARITTQRVTLTIDAAQAKDLPEHHGMRGALERRAKRAGMRWRRRLGR